MRNFFSSLFHFFFSEVGHFCSLWLLDCLCLAMSSQSSMRVTAVGCQHGLSAEKKIVVVLEERLSHPSFVAVWRESRDVESRLMDHVALLIIRGVHVD